MRKMGIILFTLCIQFPPLFMSMFRFCLRLATIHVKVLMLFTRIIIIFYFILINWVLNAYIIPTSSDG